MALGIATITSGNTNPLRTAAAVHSFAIEAQALAGIKVGKFAAPAASQNVWLDADGDGTEELAEILIRKI